MAELRLVGVSEDGERLVLVDESGTQHTIAIDERVRAGVNGHLSRLGQLTMALESRVSPREIQGRVRGGESAEHVAQSAGVPLERVLRFVGPVLREREHVAEQAKRARLAGTSPSGTGPSSLLADAVAKAASRSGIDADDVSWDSVRREDHTWVVTVGWPDGTVATWALDPLRHQATAVDLAARRISGVHDDAPVDITSGRTGATAPDFPNIADSPDFARFDADEPPSAERGGDSEATVHQLVPRAAPTLVADAHEIDAPDEAAADPAVVDDIVIPQSADDDRAPEVAPARPVRAPRRAKVPRWDDIMFGMKPKDGS
jgi:hypothetical protein